MVKTIGVISIKGGVGKTSVSSSLATDLANSHGKKVLLVDANYSAPNVGLHMDIIAPSKTLHDVLEGKTSVHSAIHRKFNVDVIPGSYSLSKRVNPFKLVDRLKKIKEDYDFVIIDSSPNLNEEMLSTILASDYLFVVSTPDYPTLYCSLRASKQAMQRGKPIIGLIMNKTYDPNFEIGLKEMEEAVGIPVVANIPYDYNVVKSVYHRIPLPLYNKRSKMAREIGRLSSSIALKKEKGFSLKKILGLNFRREEVNRQFLKDAFYSSVFKSGSGEN